MPDDREFPASDELRKRLLSEALINLNRIVENEGLDPDDIEDDYMNAPPGGVFEEMDGERQLVHVRVGQKNISLYLPQLMLWLIDRVALMEDCSRSSVIVACLWQRGVPDWLMTTERVAGDRTGSLALRISAINRMAENFIFNERTEKGIPVLIRHLRSLRETPDRRSREKARDMLLELIENVEAVKDHYWRLRLMGAVCRHYDTLQDVLGTLDMVGIDGIEAIQATLKEWQRQAVYE